MGFQPLQRERNVSRFDVRRGHAFVRSSAVGLPGAFPAAGSEAIRCTSSEVALIDEIEMSSTTNVAAINNTITMKCNDIELPVHFPGVANLVRTDRIVWRPKGNLVVHPGKAFAMKGSVATSMHAVVRFRKKRFIDAVRDGDLPTGGGLPNVASTNAVTAGGTAAGTAKAIVPAVAGQCVEILAMLFTGHNFNAAADNIRLGFWDGTTGTFAANGATISRAWRQGVNAASFAKPLVIGSTDGCIQGPSGSGVYIQATANLAGATPTGDWVIVYRYIPASRLQVVSATGAIGATPSAQGKFWVNTEAAVTVTGFDLQRARLFAAVASDTQVKIKGYIQSLTVAADVLGAGGLGISLGDGTLAAGLLTHGGLGGWTQFLCDFGAPAAIGHLLGQEETLLNTNMSSIPSLCAYATTAAFMPNRSHTVWGRFGEAKLTSQDTAGASQYGFFA